MKRIVGAKFNSIRRAADMLCLDLGEDIIDDKGNCYSQYSLHIQTSWRFVKGNEIILGSRDFYLPQDEALDDGNYDADEQSNPQCITDTSSIFDAQHHDFSKHFKDAVVKDYYINALGDLHINFTNGVCFETFTPSSRKCEEWRFLPPSDDEDHFIIFDVLN